MRTPKHLNEVLAMIDAAGFTVELGQRLRPMNLDDAAVELFEWLEAKDLNPETMDLLNGFNEDDLHYIIHSLVVVAHKRTANKS